MERDRITHHIHSRERSDQAHEEQKQANTHTPSTLQMLILFSTWVWLDRKCNCSLDRALYFMLDIQRSVHPMRWPHVLVVIKLHN